MDERQRIAINAVVGFLMTAGLYLFFGNPLELALAFGAVAGAGFGIGIWLLGRFEERREARREE